MHNQKGEIMFKWLALKILNFAQSQVDKAYAENGLDDKTFDLQLQINYLRNKHNLIKEEGEFVQ